MNKTEKTSGFEAYDEVRELIEPLFKKHKANDLGEALLLVLSDLFVALLLEVEEEEAKRLFEEILVEINHDMRERFIAMSRQVRHARFKNLILS